MTSAAETRARKFKVLDYEAFPFGISLPTINIGGWPTLQKLKIHRVLRVLKEGRGKLLDIGCGGGQFLRTISRHCPTLSECHGVDLSLTAIEAARGFQGFPTCFFEQGDGRTLPYADGSFDYVTAMDVMEHVTDTSAFLREVRRVLKPGGRFLFHVPCESSPGTLSSWMIKFDWGVYLLVHWAGHERYFTLKEADEVLQSHGFRPIRRLYSYHPIGQVARLWDLLNRIFFRKFTSRNIFARGIRFCLARMVRAMEGIAVMESIILGRFRLMALGFDGAYRLEGSGHSEANRS